MGTSPYTIKYGDTLGAIAAANKTTVADLMKNNPTITDANKISAGSTLNLAPVAAPPVTPTATTPPVTPTTPTKTIAEAAKSVVPDYQYINDTDPAIQAYLDRNKTAASGTIDEAATRQAARERVQAQVDALKLAGAQALATAKRNGLNRLGQVRSSNARSGTLGSSFGDAANDTVVQENTDIEAAQEAETAAKVNALLTQADKDASQDIKDRKDAQEKGADAYVDFITKRDTDRATKATALAKLFAAQGVDPTKLSDDDAKKLKSTYGIDPKVFGGMVADAKSAKDKADAENKKTAMSALPDSAKEFSYRAELTPAQQKAYDEYQTADANRKAVIARSNAGGNNGFTPYQTFQATQSLKKSTQTNTAALNEIVQNGQNVNDTWNRYKTGGAKDLNGTSQVIITKFNKLLDPTSVVRETEYDRSGQGQAMLSNIQGKIAKISAGGPGLTEGSLQELVDLGNIYVKNAKASIDEQNRTAKEEAAFFGINPDFVVRGGTVPTDGAPTAPAATRQVEYPKGSGKVYNVDAAGNMTPVTQ